MAAKKVAVQPLQKEENAFLDFFSTIGTKAKEILNIDEGKPKALLPPPPIDPLKQEKETLQAQLATLQSKILKIKPDVNFEQINKAIENQELEIKTAQFKFKEMRALEII